MSVQKLTHRKSQNFCDGLKYFLEALVLKNSIISSALEFVFLAVKIKSSVGAVGDCKTEFTFVTLSRVFPGGDNFAVLRENSCLCIAQFL